MMTKKDLIQFFSRNAWPLLGVIIAAGMVVIIQQTLFVQAKNDTKSDAKNSGHEQPTPVVKAQSDQDGEKEKKVSQVKDEGKRKDSWEKSKHGTARTPEGNKDDQKSESEKGSRATSSSSQSTTAQNCPP